VKKFALCVNACIWLFWIGLVLHTGYKAQAAEVQWQDLRDWNPRKTPVLALQGMWSLSRKRDPKQVQIPALWQQRGASRNISDPSVGNTMRYRLRVRLPAELVGERLMLDFGDIRPYFRAHVNGKLVAQSGVQVSDNYVVASRAHAQLPFVSPRADIEIEVFVKNVGELRNGLRSAPLLGREVEIQQRLLRRQTVLHFLLGSTVIMLFYHLFLYLQRRDASLLYFTGICATSLLYYGFYFAHIPELLWHDMSFNLSVRFTRLGVYAFGYLGFAYIHSLFPMPHYARLRWWVLGMVGLGLCSLALPLPLMQGVYGIYLLLSFTWLFYCAQHIIRVCRAQFAANRLFFMSLIVLMLCIFQDALYDMNMVRVGLWTPWGHMIFLLGQAAFLSQRFHQDFLTVQTLQQTLYTTNQNLESIVDERTDYLRLQSQQIRQMTAFKEKITRMIVHDLRTPLSTILYFTHQRAPNAEQSQWVHEAALKANDMLKELSEVKNIEQEQLKVNLQENELASLVDGALKQVLPWIERKRLRMAFSIPTGLRVQADQILLSRVLQNLLNNACEHSVEGGTVYLSACHQNQWVYLCLIDHGPGIEASRIPTLFQLKATGTRGLGLPFCKMAVTAQHGHLYLESSHQGTIIHLHMPCAQSQMPRWELSALDIKALTPRLTALRSYPFYRFSELDALLQAMMHELAEAHHPYIQALHNALCQADENHYNELLEQLTHACITRR
jgi:signal transduction histidine kinase